jgi:hypothetical protein
MRNEIALFAFNVHQTTTRGRTETEGERERKPPFVMVDYSRFDHVGSSSDDDDEDGDVARRGPPNVTRLEGPSSVTFGGGRGRDVTVVTDATGGARGSNGVGAPGDDGAPGASPDDANEDVVDISERAYAKMLEDERRATTPAVPVVNAASTPAARNWDAVTAKMTRNGGTVFGDGGGGGDGGVVYFWCQDAKEATLSVVVAPGTRAKDVDVRVTARDVRVSMKTASTSGPAGEVFAGEWSHEIEAEPKDEDDDDDFGDAAPTFGDWEITDFEGTGTRARRVVRVTVRKKGSEMLVHWWRSCIKGGPETDPATFEDRSASNASKAKAVWEQAQEMFRERIKNRELVEVDVHDGDTAPPAVASE